MADLDRLVRDGFVRPGHSAEFQPTPEGYLLEAELECDGGIVVSVRKLAIPVSEASTPDPEVETRWYSYHVSLRGVGNLFRYDSPFLPDRGGHHEHHHCHRYRILEGDQEGEISVLEDEGAVPHLGEVIREAREWYYANLDALRERGFVS